MIKIGTLKNKAKSILKIFYSTLETILPTSNNRNRIFESVDQYLRTLNILFQPAYKGIAGINVMFNAKDRPRLDGIVLVASAFSTSEFPQIAKKHRQMKEFLILFSPQKRSVRTYKQTYHEKCKD